MNLVIVPTKSQFTFDEEIALEINFETSGVEKKLSDDYSVSITVFHFSDEVLSFQQELSTQKNIISLPIPDEWKLPGRGFGVICTCSTVENSAGNILTAHTAFDIEGEDTRVVRYGFLCDFKPEDSGNVESSIDFLRRFHITHVQYYDWVYRHHNYHPPEESFTDMMGKAIDLSLVKNYLAACREAGMTSMGYGAVYAASKTYLEEHPEQGLYDIDGNPFDLIDIFFIMDISLQSAWSEQIISQYAYAVKDVGFDGLHMDTYGYPKRGWRISGNSVMEPVFQDKEFPDFINRVHTELPEAQLIFNNVGNWPVHATGPADQDAVYIEVWEPYTTYAHLQNIIQDALQHKKPVILAAYLAPFKDDPKRDGRSKGALYSAKYLIAAIHSNGATPLLFGEQGSVLTQAYYNDYSVLKKAELDELSAYQDFTVRYRELFFDASLEDITATHVLGENREYGLQGSQISFDGQPGTVWTVIRQSEERKVISLINLTSQQDNLWNEIKTTSTAVACMTIEVPRDQKINRVFYCSPDVDNGEAKEIPFHNVMGVRGPSIQFTINDLSVWGVVCVE
jgi:dextranase